jgi:H+/Cl- antiporter ClcA
MTQSPITSFVIVMEMTANHEMLLPLMATAVIANGISRSVAPVPLYHALAFPALRRAEGRLHSARPSSKPPALLPDAKTGSADAGTVDQRL